MQKSWCYVFAKQEIIPFRLCVLPNCIIPRTQWVADTRTREKLNTTMRSRSGYRLTHSGSRSASGRFWRRHCTPTQSKCTASSPPNKGWGNTKNRVCTEIINIRCSIVQLCRFPRLILQQRPYTLTDNGKPSSISQASWKEPDNINEQKSRGCGSDCFGLLGGLRYPS